MTWAAVASAAVTAGASIWAGSKAAGAQEDASNSAIDEQRRQFDAMQANQQPYMQAGTQALGGLSQLANGDYSSFMNSPDYQYARGEMMYGLDHGAAARGSLYSGGSGLDMAQHLNGLASQNLGNYRNSLQWLGGLGQNAAAGVGNNGMQMAGNIGNAYNNTANAQASSYGATGSSLGNLAGSIAGAFNPQQQNASSYGGGSNSFGLPTSGTPGYASGGPGTFWGYS